MLLERELRVGELGDGHRVAAREAGRAEGVARRVGRAHQSIELEVRERVDVEVGGDLADRHVGREQLRAAAGVHAVVAGPAVRRRRHTEVHLRRARLAQHRDHLARRRAAHDRVVHDDEALAADVLGERVELESNATGAELLARLDERATDVPVLHETVAVGDAGGAREALRRGDPRLRHGHDHVGLDGRLPCELFAHPLPCGMHAAAEQVRVGPREVHELEEAELRVGLGEPVLAHARRVDHQHLAGFDLSHEVRAHDVERGRLAREHPAALDPTEHQWPEAVAIAHTDEVRLVHEDEREPAGETRQHALERDLEVTTVGARLGRVLPGDELGDERRVGRGVDAGRRRLEPGQLAEALRELDGVREVPVVTEGEPGITDRAVHRLRVAPGARAGRGVAVVADREMAVERGEATLVEHLRHEAHVLDHGDRLAVTRRDPGRLLAPVLERVEPEIGEVRDGLARRVHAEDPAGVPGSSRRRSTPRCHGSSIP